MGLVRFEGSELTPFPLAARPARSSFGPEVRVQGSEFGAYSLGVALEYLGFGI
jgi:hypothetical protein